MVVLLLRADRVVRVECDRGQVGQSRNGSLARPSLQPRACVALLINGCRIGSRQPPHLVSMREGAEHFRKIPTLVLLKQNAAAATAMTR
jgi:hypothetical protein